MAKLTLRNSIEEIIRFNVYSQVYSKRNPVYYLESFDNYSWKSVTHSGHVLTYDTLDMVAKKIVEIAPNNNSYLRVIFEKKPQEKTGMHDGINLNEGNPYLIRGLTDIEQENLLERIDNYFNEKKK